MIGLPPDLTWIGVDVDFTLADICIIDEFGTFVDVWCHRIGPSSCILARRLLMLCLDTPAPHYRRVLLSDLAAATGLFNASLLRTLDRLVRFKVASFDGTAFTIRYSVWVPSLSAPLQGTGVTPC